MLETDPKDVLPRKLFVNLQQRSSINFVDRKVGNEFAQSPIDQPLFDTIFGPFRYIPVVLVVGIEVVRGGS